MGTSFKEKAMGGLRLLGTFKFWKELIIMTLGMAVGAAGVY